MKYKRFKEIIELLDKYEMMNDNTDVGLNSADCLIFWNGDKREDSPYLEESIILDVVENKIFIEKEIV